NGGGLSAAAAVLQERTLSASAFQSRAGEPVQAGVWLQQQRESGPLPVSAPFTAANREGQGLRALEQVHAVQGRSGPFSDAELTELAHHLANRVGRSVGLGDAAWFDNDVVNR